jgi:hypothetical protein
MKDEFYIGWEDRAAPGIRRVARLAVAFLLVATIGLALALGAAQRTIGVSVFEWGTIKKFTGVLKLEPYPHLLVARPGAPGEASVPGYSTYYMVAPFKFGLDRAKLSALDGKLVALQATLIYRGNQTMLEALTETIVAASPPPALPPGLETIELGRQTLVGEIVDSKCFLGVMNPGQLLPHRACAIRCISGGIPPVLLVRSKAGSAIYLLLVSAAGKPVNQQVLDLVAEPVRITGDVERQGDLLILRADPAGYERLR